MPIPCLIIAGCAAAGAVAGSSCCEDDGNGAMAQNNAAPATQVIHYTVVQQPPQVQYVYYPNHAQQYAPQPQPQWGSYQPTPRPLQQWAPQYRQPAYPYRGSEPGIQMTTMRSHAERSAPHPPSYAVATGQVPGGRS